MFLFRPHYFVSRRLADRFGDCRAGDAVLGSGYPVRNALSRHPDSDEVFDRRYTESSQRTSLGSVDRLSKPRRYLTKLETRGREGGWEGEREGDDRR